MAIDRHLLAAKQGVRGLAAAGVSLEFFPDEPGSLLVQPVYGDDIVPDYVVCPSDGKGVIVRYDEARPGCRHVAQARVDARTATLKDSGGVVYTIHHQSIASEMVGAVEVPLSVYHAAAPWCNLHIKLEGRLDGMEQVMIALGGNLHVNVNGDIRREFAACDRTAYCVLDMDEHRKPLQKLEMALIFHRPWAIPRIHLHSRTDMDRSDTDRGVALPGYIVADEEGVFFDSMRLSYDAGILP